ncbi:MAG: type 4a pilus biogenesis protein PilO [Candidatus Latescibacterota bacterium]|nr:MAG: type 4a pilus biogenesis protein PilO [Candidatus Latescibacterota bacterium]
MSLRDPRIQKILLTAFASVTILWAFFISDLLPFGYSRRSEEISKLETEHEELTAELEKARRTIGNLPRLEREYADLQRRWEEAQELLPSDKEIALLLTQITQAGEQAGVHFELFKPEAPRPQEFYNENPIEVQVACGYHQLGIFLSRLANLSRLVNVSGLQLDGYEEREREEADEAGRGEHVLTANFTATAYSLRDPAATPMQAPPAEQQGRKIQRPKPRAAAAQMGGRSH